MTDDCCGAGISNGHFDLAVIGAGSAGYSAAITAADQGARVALIGHGTIGGTCVNVGCVPSKALIRAAEAVHHANRATRFSGISAAGEVRDWSALRAQKDELVASLRQAKYIDLLPAYNGIAYLEGKARLGNGGVGVEGKHIDAGKIIVATGSHEFVPDIPGIRDVPFLTSTSAFEMESLPESMIVIGGGYIGCELAQMFARVGVKVTIVFRRRLLPEGEPEISEALAGYFKEEGITARRIGGYDGIRASNHGIALSVTIDGSAETLEARRVLLSAGREANTVGLGLEEAGVALMPNGGIKVDDRMRTTKAGVYAAGDVTGREPAVVFTDPQVASVGLTEAAAATRGIDAKTSILSLDNVPRALAARDTRGLIKLVADGSTNKLIGAHVLAPEGADSIQTAALAIREGMTYAELGEMVFPYLTTVEGLKLAAQTFEMDVSKLSCCAG
jgi:mercuric reductase